MKRFFSVLIILLILAGLVFGGSILYRSNKSSDLPQASEPSRADSEFFYLPAKFSAEKIYDLPSAVEAMNDLKDDLGFNVAAEVFTGASENSMDDLRFYRLIQEFEGIPVFGRTMTVIADERGEALHVSGNYLNISGLSIKPELEEVDAKKMVLEYMMNTLKCHEGSINVTGGDLSIYSLDLTPTLCWTFYTSGQTKTGPEYRQVFVHARDGSIVQAISAIYSFNATGQNGAQYDLPLTTVDGEQYLWDKNRNIQVFTLSYQKEVTELMGKIIKSVEALKAFTGASKWLKLSDNNLSGADALGNAVATYDFFNKILSRKQFDGKNGQLHIFVNGKTSGRDNGFYAKIDDSKSFMIFIVNKETRKEYSKNLDFVAHEFVHGVTVTTAGLLSGNQSGAINEGLSDVFGELVEKYVTGINDWNFAKERNMTIKQTLADFNADRGVHYNGGILNYVSYLIGSGINTEGYTKAETRLLNPKIADKQGITDFAKLLYGVQLILPANATFNQYGIAMMTMAHYLESKGEITKAQFAGIKGALQAGGITNELIQELPSYTKIFEGTFTVRAIDSSYKPLPKFSLNIFEGKNTGAGFTPVFSEAGVTDKVLVSLPAGRYTAVVRDTLNNKEQKYLFYVKSDIFQGETFKDMTILCLFEGGSSLKATKPESTKPIGAPSGSIEILNVSPRAATPGVETTFTLKVKYNYQNAQGAIVYAGANTHEVDGYRIYDEYLLPDRSGTYTFKFKCVPTRWSSTDFAIFANISEYPHGERWRPLNATMVPISLSSKGSSKGFSLPGSWTASDGTEIVFRTDGTFTFDWGFGIVENGTYSVASTSEDAFPISMKGTSLLQMMQLLYGTVDSSYHFEILKDDDDHINLVQVYDGETAASSPCKLPLTRR